jgi:hypothetical protein
MGPELVTADSVLGSRSVRTGPLRCRKREAQQWQHLGSTPSPAL